MLAGLDDGASNLPVSLQMAKMSVNQGVEVVACTPHILPGLYHNSGPAIRQAIAELQSVLDAEGIALRLVTGADVHMCADFVAGLRSGRLLSIADSRYILVEPPHHTAPPHVEDFFFNLIVAGYVPILTHPERLSWITSHYETIKRLARSGVCTTRTFCAAGEGNGDASSRCAALNRAMMRAASSPDTSVKKCRIGIDRGASSSRLMRNMMTAESAATRAQALSNSKASLIE